MILSGHKLLLTGLTGQVGGAFADQLTPHNEVWGFARFSRPGSRERAEKAGVKTVVGDFTTGNFQGLPNDFDYVIHVAANTKPGTAEVGMVQNAEGTGLLMHYCRTAKAFLYVSATGIYSDHPDPFHLYAEDEDVGGSTPFAPNYGPTKLAAEGVVRTLARILNFPATIARLNVSYGGPYDDGGLPGIQLDSLVAGKPIRLPKSKTCVHSPIHEDDMVRQLEPLLKAASVPATVVNWGGAEPAIAEDWCRYMADLMGVEPKFEFSDDRPLPSTATDTALGRTLGLEWNVHWKEGMRRMIEARHPEVKLKPAC
jgi:nucleoside-diphosphate-sugar epimerase